MTDSIFNVLDDLKELQYETHVRTTNVRRKIKDSASMVRYYVGKMESR